MGGCDVGGPEVRVGHSDVQHRLEVLSSHVLCQQSEALGAGGEVVLERHEALGLGVLHTLTVLLSGEPGALAVDGHLGEEQEEGRGTRRGRVGGGAWEEEGHEKGRGMRRGGA